MKIKSTNTILLMLVMQLHHFPLNATQPLSDDDQKGVLAYPIFGTYQLKPAIKKLCKSSATPILYFTADTCKSCLVLEQHIDDQIIIDAFENSVLMIVDIGLDMQSLLDEYNVNSIPTYFKFNKEREVVGTITTDAWEKNTVENMAEVLNEFIHSDKYDSK